MTQRLKVKRRDLVKVTRGPHAGRVGLVVDIEHQGPKANRYRVLGHDDQALGWFTAEQLAIVQYRPAKGAQAMEPHPAQDEALADLDRLLSR